MTQRSLSDWGADPEDSAAADPFPFDDYGPTADRPIPEAEIEDPDRRYLRARGVDVDGWDELEYGGTGGYHVDDAERPGRREAEADRHAAAMAWIETREETDSDSETMTDYHIPDDAHREPSSIHTDYSELEEIPEKVPICAEKAEIELAERLLRAAVRKFGHHDPTRTAIIRYHRNTDRDGHREAFERAAYDLDPAQVNRGQLSGSGDVSTATKAAAIVDWMEAKHPDELAETREEYNQYLREKCEEALEKEQKTAEAEAFIDDPPEEVAGWVRIEAEHPDVVAAYRGVRVDTPSVLVIGYDDEGRPDAPIFTYDDWREADGFADYRPRGELRPNTWGTVAPETITEAVSGSVAMMEHNEQDETPPPIEEDDGPEDAPAYDQGEGDDGHPTGDELAEQLADIDGVSKQAARSLARHYFDLEDIAEHSDEHLLQRDGVGAATVDALREAADGGFWKEPSETAGGNYSRIGITPDIRPVLVYTQDSIVDRATGSKVEYEVNISASNPDESGHAATLFSREQARAKVDELTENATPEEILETLGPIVPSDDGEDDGAGDDAPAVEDGEEDDDSESTDGDGKTYMGIGSGRRRALDAIEETPHLDPIESFGSVDEMAEAIEEIHIRDYSTPPEDTIKKLRHHFGRLPDEQAERYYLNDYKLCRTINAARRAFNEWLGRKKRYDQMPGAMEAGASNYPVKKHRKRRDSERKGREKLDEKLNRLNGRAKGAFRRALKKAGHSEAELNEQKREDKREQRRQEWEPGDIVVYRSPNLHAGAIVRLNKKSVRVQRRNNLQNADFGPDGEFRRETIDLDSDHIAKFEADELHKINDEALDRSQTLPETLEAAQRQLLGDEWVEENRDTDQADGASDDAPAVEEEPEAVTDGGAVAAEPEPDDGPDLPGAFDAEAETVGDGWEGEFIYASWGYGQTNVDLAQIVDVSGSGKTVLARKVRAETVGHGPTSNRLRPVDDPYGDEFRLHVRGYSSSDTPSFRGSYPLGPDGDMDDGTRLGSFGWFEDVAGDSISETATGYGH